MCHISGLALLSGLLLSATCSALELLYNYDQKDLQIGKPVNQHVLLATPDSPYPHVFLFHSERIDLVQFTVNNNPQPVLTRNPYRSFINYEMLNQKNNTVVVSANVLLHKRGNVLEPIKT